MQDLIFAIMMALQSLFPQEATGYSADEYQQKLIETTQYIFDNELYLEKEGGGSVTIIDPDVSL